MTTFEQAKEAVRKVREAEWEDNDTPGDYMVADYGWEDSEAFLIVDGAREYLEDEDPDFMEMDAPAMFVDKATGIVLEAVYLDSMDRIDDMTPIGDVPEFD